MGFDQTVCKLNCGFLKIAEIQKVTTPFCICLLYAERGCAMKKEIKALLAAAILLLVIVLCKKAGDALLEQMAEEKRADMTMAEQTGMVQVVLDPGHGGKDPGKVGANGEEEKHINLKIAYALKEYLEQKGIGVVLTRTDDERLGASQGEDLKKRAEMIDACSPALAVSIHQNSYPDQNVRGPQIFYYEHSDAAKEAGMILQEHLKEKTGEYTRELKSNTSYYLLKNTRSPVVIIECGFLSCPEEAEMLSDPEYQSDLAEAFGEGITEYIQG